MSDPHLHKSSLYTSIPTNSGRWIRLLLLLQGTPSDPITCLLQPFDLDTLERCDDDKKLSPYAALSYVWGSRASPREITCNGQPLKVTRNLFDALVAIRHPTTAGPLWVDAICINQEDVEERNHQVGLMASVYRQARRVFIWLGHGDREFVEPAFTYICQRANHVYAQVRWIVQDAEARRASYVTRGEEVDGSKLHLEDPRPTAAQYSAFATFLRQPWFFRLWIVQEVSLARAATLFWGDSCIDFEFVMVALEKWREDSSRFAPPVGLDNIAAIRFNRRAERKRIPMPFARMMHGGRKFDCKDPRDRVYALLGMRSIGSDPENGQLFIQPDYNLPVLDLYTRVAKKVVIEQRQPYLLSAVHHDRDITPGLPSWVPNWNRPSSPLDTFQTGRGAFTRTGPLTDEPGVDVSLVIQDGRECLRIAGFVVGTVDSVTPVLRASDIMNRFANEDSVLSQGALKDLCSKFNDDAILKAMSRNRTHPFKILETYPDPLFGHPNLYSLLTEPTAPVQYPEEYEALIEQFRSSIASLCDGRRLVGLRAEYIYLGCNDRAVRLASAPAIAQERDVVCMLFGGYDYYLVRDGGGECVRLLGTCDIQGFTYEQNVEAHRLGKKPTRYFNIF